MRRTMERNFHRIFGGERFGGQKDRNHYFIDDFIYIFDETIMYRMRFLLGKCFPVKAFFTDFYGLFSRNSNNSYRSNSIGSRECTNSVLIHATKVVKLKMLTKKA